jgi:hypothetical protein
MPSGTKPVAMAGRKFNRLTVVEKAPNSPSGHIMWLCRCDCGNETVVQGGNLRSGHTQSCGCLSIESTRKAKTTHGHASRGTGSLTYKSWISMRERCTMPKAVSYPRYGGRGIRVCDRWLGKSGFVTFLADMGERPEGATLHRIEGGTSDYEPGNVEWSTVPHPADRPRGTPRPD